MASKDAEGMYGVASEGETIMPHLVYSEADISQLYPPSRCPTTPIRMTHRGTSRMSWSRQVS